MIRKGRRGEAVVWDRQRRGVVGGSSRMVM